MKSTKTVYIAIIISMIFWGMSFIWTDKLLISGYPPMSVILIRLLLVIVLIGGGCLAAGKLQKIEKGDFKYFLLMSLFEPFLYFVGETYGIKLTGSPSLASILVALIPLFCTLAGYKFFKEKLTYTNLAGVFLSVAGVYIVLAHGYGTIKNIIPGSALLMLAVFSAVFYSVVIRKLTEKYNPFMLVVFQNLIGIFYFFPMVLIFERKQLAEVNVTFTNAYPFLMLAVFASGVAFLLFIYCIKNLGVTKTNIFITLIPVITMLFAYFTVGEQITFMRIVGVITVVTGLVLSQIPSKSGKVG